ncbi:alpha/beta fold hydrolase [Candidatus Deianiraea vastatrix]|uniref:Proline iminopeptidase n=1 Tax=Candidatus Deianiraea vastatrix TaxID=2163644 RepID=A0A5B8XBZ0_9RICK|nr:alpha/beta fold hydrolase [Candidatus Deianiraea vastatrix]QED22869.1 Proline aminopeptidase/iminopeptidase [Candidatus Deianiraea vastatrix]
MKKYIKTFFACCIFLFADKVAFAKNPVLSGYLKIDEKVSIYYETHGNKNGVPVLVFHGGPGNGMDQKMLRFFDLKKYYVILFDQRGCGKSIPVGVFKENTTQDIIEDARLLISHLDIKKYRIYGYSWGSTLALNYAQKYPENIEKMILSGVFLARKVDDENWININKIIFPDYYEDLISILPSEKDILSQYYDLICVQKDENLRKIAAAKFHNFHIPISKMFTNENQLEKPLKPEEITDEAMLEMQIYLAYTKNNFFLDENNWINAEKMKIINDNIPTVILKSRYDLDAFFNQGWQLKKLLPNAQFITIYGAGHGKYDKNNEIEITKALK